MGKHEANRFDKESIKNKRRALLANNTLFLKFKPVYSEEIKLSSPLKTPSILFEMLKDANQFVVKGLTLRESLKELQLCGWISPYTLFLSGSSEDVKVVKKSWVKRTMRNPIGFYIKEFGFVQDFVVETIPQSPFLSLTTALFDAIADLNQQNIYPNKDALHSYLQKKYSEIVTPDLKLIHDCLSRLIRERRLYHNGRGYFVLKDENFLNEVMTSSKNAEKISSNSNTSTQTELDASHKDCARPKSHTNNISLKKNSKKNNLTLSVDEKNSSVSIMKFLTRNDKLQNKKNESKNQITENNSHIQSSIKSNITSNYGVTSELEETSNLSDNEIKIEYTQVKRSNSFHGTDSEKSFKKGVSFAIVGCKNEKDVSNFKRHYSFGAGSQNVPRLPQMGYNNRVLVSKTISSFNTIKRNDFEEQKVRHYEKRYTDVLDEKLDEKVPFQSIVTRDTYKENLYDDLGSALSITNHPITDMFLTKKFHPSYKELSLADEMQIAEDNKIDLHQEKTQQIIHNVERLAPYRKKDAALNNLEISFTANPNLPQQNLDISDVSQSLKKKSNGYLYAPFADSNLTKSDTNANQAVSFNLNDERKRNQKERNSLLFAEKRGTLRVVGFV